MVIPKGLAMTIGVLVLGFFFSFARTIRKKSTESGYRKLDATNMVAYTGLTPTNHSTSYQNPTSDQYALPKNQKDLTYCVIDGRLVDS